MNRPQSREIVIVMKTKIMAEAEFFSGMAALSGARRACASCARIANRTAKSVRRRIKGKRKEEKE
jgi:hypothetical protein